MKERRWFECHSTAKLVLMVISDLNEISIGEKGSCIHVIFILFIFLTGNGIKCGGSCLAL